MKKFSKIITKLLLTSLLFSVAACYNFKPPVGSIISQDMLKGRVEGPPNFKKGWTDGCETGISVSSNAFQRHFYAFTQDPELAKDHEYYTGWKTSFWVCSRYMLFYTRRHLI